MSKITKEKNTDLWNVMMSEMEIEHEKRFKKGIEQERNRIVDLIEDLSADPSYTHMAGQVVCDEIIKRISQKEGE